MVLWIRDIGSLGEPMGTIQYNSPLTRYRYVPERFTPVTSPDATAWISPLRST